MAFTQKIFNEPRFSSSDKDKLLKEIKKIQKEIKEGALPQFSAIFRKDDLNEIIQKAESIRKNFSKVIVIGMGGSSLGAKTLSVLSKNPDYITFMDSIDPKTVEKQLNSLSLKNTYFIAISKSGETIETLVHTIMIMNLLQKAGIGDLNNRFLFITDNKNSTLTNIAKEFKIEILFHPSDVGGRYSYLSVVGLLPSALLGLNIKNVRLGAKEYLEKKIISSDVDNGSSNSDILKSCLAQLSLFSNGVSMSVFMHYLDDLTNFVEWYRQLFAESIGKDGFGITPVSAVGTKDQHSQLQLYLHGPKNKFYTFLTMEKYKENYKLDISFVKNFKYKINGKYLGEIFKIEEMSTIEVLKNHNLPVRVFEFKELTEKSLSGLMTQMFIEVILLCRLKNINPFDQPAVELRKQIARRSLL